MCAKKDMTDEDIVTRVRAGDSELFGILIERYEEKLRRYARKFLRVGHEIDDLVQDVFIKAYTNLHSFDVTKRFSPWVYRIAHNVFVNELRRKERSGYGLFDMDILLPRIPAPETADADTLTAELESELGNYIEQLPPKYREVLILHYFETLSYQEISDILQIPVTTVGVRMSRGRKLLKSFYPSHHA